MNWTVRASSELCVESETAAGSKSHRIAIHGGLGSRRVSTWSQTDVTAQFTTENCADHRTDAIFAAADSFSVKRDEAVTQIMRVLHRNRNSTGNNLVSARSCDICTAQTRETWWGNEEGSRHRRLEILPNPPA
jgi:hypothetical protein